MPLPDCAPFGDCDFHKLSFEQKFNYLIEDDGTGCPRLKTVSSGVTLPSASRTYTRTLVSASGSVAATSRHITFETSEDFSGTIAGTIAYPNRNYTIEVNQNDDTIGTVAYTITTGNIIINRLA